MTSLTDFDVPTSTDPPSSQLAITSSPPRASKRPAEATSLTPQKRARTSSPTPSVSPTSSDHSSQPASAAATEPFTPEEREHQHRRNENKRIRARQLEAHLIEVAEKLKHTNHEWMAAPMIVLIQPILSFVLLHENKFDAQIEGLRAEFNAGIDGLRTEFKAGYEELGARITAQRDEFRAGYEALATRMTKMENKLDACMANMDAKFELIMAAMKA